MEEVASFRPKNLILDAATVADYIRAVGDGSALYRGTSLVPPMAVAAVAMGAMAEGLSLPGGTIHVSQELEFSGEVSVGDTVTVSVKPGRRVERGQMRLMSLDIEVAREGNRVLGGKVTFMLPPSGQA